jgi:site-specific recombinase XerD
VKLGDIVLKGKSAPNYAVIYIVRDREDYLYIGKSKNVEIRLAQHLGYENSPSIGHFDEIARAAIPQCWDWEVDFVEIPDEIISTGNQWIVDHWISNEEIRLIREYHPKFNLQFNDSYQTSSPSPKLTIHAAMKEFVDMVKRSRSSNTTLSYTKGLDFFSKILNDHGFPISDTLIDQLTEDTVPWLLDALKDFSPATEQLYVVAVKRFFNYLSARRLSEINLPRLKEFVLQQSRRPGQRLPQFPRDDIETIINYVISNPLPSDPTERLYYCRDRAFLLILADTGLRVHEACNLRRGDINWNEGQAIIIGKGNKQAVVRFSDRVLHALRDYLSARASLDGSSGRSLSALPLFARHDKGAGKKVKPITTTTGRKIIAQLVSLALGPQAVGTITPHSFRHYFVTTILRASGNLKVAQELARHSNISVTERYAHLTRDELDRMYREIFDK